MDDLLWPAATAVLIATTHTLREREKYHHSARRTISVRIACVCVRWRTARPGLRPGPWSVCDTERLTAGCIGDMSESGDRGLLTAGAHGHTHTHSPTTLIAPQTERSGDGLCLVVCVARTPPRFVRPSAKDMKDPSKAVLFVPAAITSHSWCTGSGDREKTCGAV